MTSLAPRTSAYFGYPIIAKANGWLEIYSPAGRQLVSARIAMSTAHAFIRKHRAESQNANQTPPPIPAEASDGVQTHEE